MKKLLKEEGENGLKRVLSSENSKISTKDKETISAAR